MLEDYLEVLRLGDILQVMIVETFDSKKEKWNAELINCPQYIE